MSSWDATEAVRGAWVAFLVLLPLAGCLGGDDRPPLRSFTATYLMSEGGLVELRLDGPYDLLGPDGQVRPAYTLASRSAALPDRPWSHEGLDASLRVVRQEGCWVFIEGSAACGHERIDFLPWHEHPSWGIGLPLRLATERHGDLVRVADPHADPEDLADAYWEYKPGEIWPQRYVRESADFDVRLEPIKLLSVEPGRPLAGAVPWPVAPQPAHAAVPDELFPGADRPLLGMAFTVADAVQALRDHPEAGPWLDGGCIGDLWHHAWPEEQPGVQLPPLFAPERVDGLSLGVVDSAGILSHWGVDLVRDAFGEETFQVQSGSGTTHSAFACAERAAAQVTVEDFLAAVPEQLPRTAQEGFTVTWWRHPDHDDRFAVPEYHVQWAPDEGGHFSSATMDASTGWWIGFSYMPGHGLDPPRQA